MVNAVITQPRYLPAINYLQRLHFADTFLILDVVQRQSRGWENRNKLLLPRPKWLTIPISSPKREIILRTSVQDNTWIKKHKKTIHQFYSKSPYYDEETLEKLYSNLNKQQFTDIILQHLKNTCNLIGIKPNIVRASDLLSSQTNLPKGPELLLELCKLLGADLYISGPNGRQYGIEDVFSKNSVKVKYHKFIHPHYRQHGSEEFFEYMGFIDFLFNVGIKRFRQFICSTPVLEE